MSENNSKPTLVVVHLEEGEYVNKNNFTKKYPEKYWGAIIVNANPHKNHSNYGRWINERGLQAGMLSKHQFDFLCDLCDTTHFYMRDGRCAPGYYEDKPARNRYRNMRDNPIEKASDILFKAIQSGATASCELSKAMEKASNIFNEKQEQLSQEVILTDALAQTIELYNNLASSHPPFIFPRELVAEEVLSEATRNRG